MNIDRTQYAALAKEAERKGRNKYRAVKVSDDGYTFDSKREHRHYCELKQLVKAGAISDLEVHPKFTLEWREGVPFMMRSKKNRDKLRPLTFTLDFAYIDSATDERVVVDVKSPATITPEYSIKRAIFERQFPQFKFVEVM